jgi:hypothetical protein
MIAALTARDEVNKRAPKRSEPTGGGSVPGPSKRPRSERPCTNPFCKSPRGHSFDQCVTYGGGSQGAYSSRWRGPWNIHLPPEQRSAANNIPPTTHPAFARMAPTPRPAAHFLYQPTPQGYPDIATTSMMQMAPQYGLQYPQIQYPSYPLQAPPTQVAPAPMIQPDIVSNTPFSPYGYSPNAQTRHDLNFTPSTSDDKPSIHAVTFNETPNCAWSASLNGEVMVVTKPILEDVMARTDICYHDSGANRHVFHDKTAFETYESITPVTVSGFGHNHSAAAIGQGTVRIEGRYGNRVSQILLRDALHIPAARSNLISSPQLDRMGIASMLADGLATLMIRGQGIIGGALYNGMYRLNITVMRPAGGPQLRNTNLGALSTITPLVAAATSDQAGFYTA